MASGTEQPSHIVEKLLGCARCGEDHEETIVFRPLTIPVREGIIVYATHWAPCPSTCEPILMRLTEARQA